MLVWHLDIGYFGSERAAIFLVLDNFDERQSHSVPIKDNVVLKKVDIRYDLLFRRTVEHLPGNLR